jgi:hypothetical protein
MKEKVSGKSKCMQCKGCIHGVYATGYTCGLLLECRASKECPALIAGALNAARQLSSECSVCLGRWSFVHGHRWLSDLLLGGRQSLVQQWGDRSLVYCRPVLGMVCCMPVQKGSLCSWWNVPTLF